MIDDILVKVLSQLSLEGIRQVFGKPAEKFTDAELKALTERNKDAAWAMYVEMLTRITTQPLPDEDGDERTALDSVYKLFEITREILKDAGRESPEFTRLAVLILNQKVRPVTDKWHPLSLKGAFEDPASCAEFRAELRDLQGILRGYMQVLAALAGVEDITDISDA